LWHLADMETVLENVRFRVQADIGDANLDVCF
jgi:hypothetical protein